jgi:uncharacterized protein YpmB
LCADYKKYFPNYKGAEDLEQLMIKKENSSLKEQLLSNRKKNRIWIIIGCILLLICIIYIFYSKQSEKKLTQKLLQEVGIKHLIEKIDKKTYYSNILKNHISVMHNSIVPFEQERFDLVISDLTKNSEGLLLNILTQINNFINNDDRKLALKNKDFNCMLNLFIKFAVDIEKNNIKDYQINKNNLIKIKHIIYLAASLQLLYFYRNPSHHYKEFWKADQHQASQTLHCYAYVLFTLVDSKLFDD